MSASRTSKRSNGGGVSGPPGKTASGGGQAPSSSSSSHGRAWYFECYNPRSELLEYDYNYDDSNKPPQPYPRLRERGEYYIDSYNDQPWSWTFGTNENVRCCVVVVHCKQLSNGFCRCLQRCSFAHVVSFVLSCIVRTEYGAIPTIKPEPSCLPWCGCCCSTQRLP